MKKIIPFTKEFMFQTKIGEIASIALDHTLKLEKEIISGEFIIYGTYKMQVDSKNEEPFNYQVPVDITIDPKYDTSKCLISIDDFSYEIINEEKLKVNISVKLDNLDIKVEPIEPIEMEIEDREEGLEEDISIEEDNKSYENEFLKPQSEEIEYSIYRVYTVKEEDTIDLILEKFGISKDLLLDYNDLDNIKAGAKIIIPSQDE